MSNAGVFGVESGSAERCSTATLTDEVPELPVASFGCHDVTDTTLDYVLQGKRANGERKLNIIEAGGARSASKNGGQKFCRRPGGSQGKDEAGLPTITKVSPREGRGRKMKRILIALALTALLQSGCCLGNRRPSFGWEARIYRPSVEIVRTPVILNQAAPVQIAAPCVPASPEMVKTPAPACP